MNTEYRLPEEHRVMLEAGHLVTSYIMFKATSQEQFRLRVDNLKKTLEDLPADASQGSQEIVKPLYSWIDTVFSLLTLEPSSDMHDRAMRVAKQIDDGQKVPRQAPRLSYCQAITCLVLLHARSIDACAMLVARIIDADGPLHWRMKRSTVNEVVPCLFSDAVLRCLDTDHIKRAIHGAQFVAESSGRHQLIDVLKARLNGA